MNIIQPISFIKEEWKFITDKSVPDIIPNKYMISKDLQLPKNALIFLTLLIFQPEISGIFVSFLHS